MSDALYETDAAKLAVAVDEARAGLAEGGIPIGAALFTTGWPFENSWIAPFPFGTVTVDNSAIQ